MAISDDGVVFNETFYGYSPKSHPHAALLVRYLALVLGSKLATWLALVTSGEFGFEREVIEKATLDSMPLPEFDTLKPEQREEIEFLVTGLQTDKVSWEAVDMWVTGLYGLGKRDLQVVQDTLEFNLPFAENKEKAQARPTSDERERFCDELRDELRPWSERFGSRLTVDQIRAPAMSPWQTIAVRTDLRQVANNIPASEWTGLLKAADKAAASEILVETGRAELLIARLAQMRYWSATQARLLAQRMAWTHLDLLKGQAGRMKHPPGRPRHDQVAELTHGVRLPLEPISEGPPPDSGGSDTAGV